jgi:hypothetical protein
MSFLLGNKKGFSANTNFKYWQEVINDKGIRGHQRHEYRRCGSAFTFKTSSHRQNALFDGSACAEGERFVIEIFKG